MAASHGIKLAGSARPCGITQKTPWQWWGAGKFPALARPMATGAMRVEAAAPEEVGAVLA